jgi:hypothetical protein
MVAEHSFTGTNKSRLTIGAFGDITIRPTTSGRFEARTRYRDWDDSTRLVAAVVAALVTGIRNGLSTGECRPTARELEVDQIIAPALRRGAPTCTGTN